MKDKVSDALGHEIIIGNSYGYAQRNNGIVTVVVGKALKITDKGSVTLTDLKRGRSLYFRAVKCDERATKSKATIIANTAFPVSLKPLW